MGSRLGVTWPSLTRADLPGLALAVLVCEVVGASPVLITATGAGTWYATLVRPGIAPPDWVFGPVWTVLFALLGVAVYLVLRDGTGRDRTVAVALFVGQYALNVAWTLVFFGGEDVAGGLAVIAALLGAILATVAAFARVSRAAALLLGPYLAWVAFATVLNWRFYVLN